jgi:23S rRNA (cytosine1962-C5)-methyltransferase
MADGLSEYGYTREQVFRQSQFLVNRLKRTQAHLARWLRREAITCYRVYDVDIPEIPLAIDRYEDMLHIAEYRTFTPVDEEMHRWRMDELCRAAAAALSISLDKVFYKVRQRQRGGQQYGRIDETGHRAIVHEGGLSFSVNLADYLDTGLFLDHRITRDLVRTRSAGKRVLNLFAYTGSFSIYALAGGAREVTTVDLSNTWLDWVEDNHLLNFSDTSRHRIIRADVLEFVESLEAKSYDCIVLDPPTFSVSKAMQSSFDVQRDHPWLLGKLLRALAPEGVIVFSNNKSDFYLDESISETAQARDITRDTIPKDFRNHKIHRCWLVQHA